MARSDSHLDRLFQSARTADDVPASVPFGFVTRVVALARDESRRDFGELSRFVRRVGYAALAVTLVTGAFAYRQLDNENADSFANDYAIADSAIPSEPFQ